MINSYETWQLDADGEIFETDFEGLVNWISEGSLIRSDKIRRGNLRWLEAGKIPTFEEFFNAKDFNQPMPPFRISTVVAANETSVKTATVSNNFANSQQNTAQSKPQHQTTYFNNLPPAQMFAEQHFENPLPPPNAGGCLIHKNTEPKYVCDTCQNVFCMECTKSYGGSFRICPMCGSFCSSIQQLQSQWETQMQYQTDMSEGFGIKDFGRAMTYPFKFKLSLFFGIIYVPVIHTGTNSGRGGKFYDARTCLNLFYVGKYAYIFSACKYDREFFAMQNR